MSSDILIIAGEPSGEDHGLTFLPELKSKLSDRKFYGVGGDRFKSLGVELLYHTTEFSGIGISEVLAKIPFYYKAMRRIEEEVKRRGTQYAILIDFQTFNLKLAKRLKAQGVDVFYYVAPQAWVWKAWRAKIIEECVHTLFTILPFEKEWFEQRGVSKVISVPHPLWVKYESQLQILPIPEYRVEGKKRLLLLPGSRSAELKNLIPIYNETLKLLKNQYQLDLELGLVGIERLKPYYQQFCQELKYFDSEQLSEALQWADITLAASGTVSLACGLFLKPTVVCYKLSKVTEWVVGLFLTYKGPVSLTNIILKKMVFPELTQDNAKASSLAQELNRLAISRSDYDNCVKELRKLHELMQGESFSVAQYLYKAIKG